MPPAEGDAPRHLWVFSDGACRGNPGPSGAGWVIQRADGQGLARGCLFLGRRTNNEAEYLAAAMGLEAALDLGATAVTLHADSQLLIRQLAGTYQVRHPHMRPLHARILALAGRLRGRLHLRHLPREHNQEADAEANRAIDEHLAGALSPCRQPC